VHNLIQFSIEELRSFHAGDCPTCIQLRRGLKEATLYAALMSTSRLVQPEGPARTHYRSAEMNLSYALSDLQEHRKIWHSCAESAMPPWVAAAGHAS
jgi:hypothetical protein